VARGYVVVIPDSFTTRGFPEGLCTDASRSRGEVAPARRVVDAYAALAQARALPFVDGRRVGVPTEHPVEIVVYPGAHHSFDSDRPVRFVASRVNMNAPGGRGATTGGDPRAWADSIRRVTEFFERTLR
jgi:dienelactone hydrolase